MATISVEDRIQQIGRRLFAEAGRRFAGDGLQARLLEWAMRDDGMKVQLFRFVDVLPALGSADDLRRHLRAYLAAAGENLPLLGQWGRNAAALGGPAGWVISAVVRAQVTGMAKQFIAGAHAGEAAKAVRRLRERRMAATLDVLGEKTVSDAEAAAYQQQYLRLLEVLAAAAPRWPADPRLDTAHGLSLPRVNLSLKLSALCAQFEPADPEGTSVVVIARLRPILDLAKAHGAFVNIDMEHYANKDVTLRIFQDLLLAPEYRDSPHLGIVLQAYLRDCEQDARALLELLHTRGVPAAIRLVKGAYWDYETIIARQHGWPAPVFTNKCETDANFERLTGLLLAHYPLVHPAIASHNVRSLASAMAQAEALGLPDDAVEYQMLYGMGDGVKRALLQQERRLRVYTPYGQLIPGMAYLVRRLLENTANTSFLRQGFAEQGDPEQLLRDPATLIPPAAPARAANGFQNTPERDFSCAEYQQAMCAVLARVRRQFDRTYPLVIGNRVIITGREIASLNPANPAEVVGRVAAAGRAEAQRAVEAAGAAFPGWRDTPAPERASLLRRAATLLENERDEFSALEVFEVGKNWREADADVCETIDYLRYYAGEMERLAGGRRLSPLPGEWNDYVYAPKGLALVIAPWNFPLAIFAGMTAAALVTGNTVVAKPASQSPVIAARFVDALLRAGLPAGVLNFCPGPAGEIGDFLVQHPKINLIAFTGSREIGCRINRLAADLQPGQQHLKRVITEMGGKNAIIVDSDADLDEAVLGVLHSAFGYQGQKCSACSRVIALEPIYRAFTSRLIEAARSLPIGPPEEPGNFLGPVIDAKARESILRYIEIGKSEATLGLHRDIAHLGDGYYVGPTIFLDVPPTAIIAQEEIFGPVLAVLKGRSLDHALEIAHGVDYALTGGLYSRLPDHLEQARRAYHVGNLYLNRKITGALVGRQPFGGFKLSGTGTKAGGPDYLLQFMDPRTVTENTLRRGFAPEE